MMWHNQIHRALLFAGLLVVPAGSALAQQGLLPLLGEAGAGFAGTLSSAQNVNGVQSNGDAAAEMIFNNAFSNAIVRMRYNRLSGAFRGATLNVGRAGEQGLEVVRLDAGSCQIQPGNRRDGFVQCALTNAHVKRIEGKCDACIGGSEPIANLASLAAAMEQGRVYLQVNTSTNPGGEIRAQMAAAGTVHKAGCDTVTDGGATIHFAGCDTVTTKDVKK